MKINKLVKVSLAILMIIAPFASISVSNATTAIYTCPSGGVLSGNTCVVTTAFVATMSYTCPQGGTLSGNTCVRLITLGGNYLTSVIYYCPSGGVLSGNTCVFTTTYLANVINTPKPKESPSPTISPTHTVSPEPTKYPIKVTPNVYYCPNGGVLSGALCSIRSPSLAFKMLSCSTGGRLLGGTCVMNKTVLATAHYSCPNKGIVSLGYCYSFTGNVYKAKATSFYCPMGGFLAGNYCVNEIRYSPRVSYYCKDGVVLSGVYCLRATNYLATLINKK